MSRKGHATDAGALAVTADIAGDAVIGSVGPDDLADVRSLHATAFRVLAGSSFTDSEVAAFTTHVYALPYTTALSEATQRGHLFSARLAGDLIGTAGWSAGDGNVAIARIRWVYVRPMFNGLGLGTRLVQTAEAAVRGAGFDTVSVEASLNAIEFFTRQGYEISSHGVRALTASEGLPVAFMRKTLTGTARAR
jgi:putative acetyltransferase